MPLDGRYYDLGDPGVLEWQADIARRFGVDAFCFFHYWYSGKLLLERPVELYRRMSSANLEYCLCWANHSWTRAWDGKNHKVLQAQDYEGPADWRAHIEYLLPFFEDIRYLHIGERPVFFVYDVGDIPDFDSMIRCWNEVLKDNGQEELYLVEYISRRNRDAHSVLSEAVYEYQPLYACRFDMPLRRKMYAGTRKMLNMVEYEDYDRIWSLILSNSRTYGQRKIIEGAFVAWDNSPRRGRKGSLIVRGASPDKFERYFSQLLVRFRDHKSEDFLIVNAWNEWGEGAVLEPTEHLEYGYLRALKRAVEEGVGGVA